MKSLVRRRSRNDHNGRLVVSQQEEVRQLLIVHETKCETESMFGKRSMEQTQQKSECPLISSSADWIKHPMMPFDPSRLQNSASHHHCQCTFVSAVGEIMSPELFKPSKSVFVQLCCDKTNSTKMSLHSCALTKHLTILPHF